MKHKKLLDIEKKNFTNNEDTVYSLTDIKEVAENVDTLIPMKLIVSRDGEEDGWLDFVFFEWVYSVDEDEYYEELCRVSGPSGFLSECRHTYFANNGYIFYMNRQVMITMIDYLTLYYDMD